MMGVGDLTADPHLVAVQTQGDHAAVVLHPTKVGEAEHVQILVPGHAAVECGGTITLLGDCHSSGATAALGSEALLSTWSKLYHVLLQYSEECLRLMVNTDHVRCRLLCPHAPDVVSQCEALAVRCAGHLQHRKGSEQEGPLGCNGFL